VLLCPSRGRNYFTNIGLSDGRIGFLEHAYNETQGYTPTTFHEKGGFV
jgi:hypothetical protein